MDLGADTSQNSFRSGKPLGFGLRQATSVHFNHRQYAEGFEFLSNLVTAGSAADDGKINKNPTHAPLPQQIALAATLVVHPLFSTRAKSSLELRASDEALRFLRHVLQTLGPVNANFAEAFAVHGSRSRGRITRQSGSGNNSPVKEDESSRIYSSFANENSLFSQAQGIWHIIGWAFNCSILRRNRWARWRLFLEFYLDVLEQYVKIERPQAFRRSDKPSNSPNFASVFEMSRNEKRKALRAIFAFGDKNALNEFGEVFKDETKARKVKPQESIRPTVNIDEDKWGDYENEEDDDTVMDDDPAESSASEDPNADVPNIDSTILRARILSLLCVAAGVDEIDSLYEMIAEFMRPLSYHEFSGVIRYICLPPDAIKKFLAFVVLPYMSSPPVMASRQTVEKNLFLECFLPYHANSSCPIENAKMSFVLERLLIQLLREEKLSFDEEILVKINKGIAARNKHVTSDSKKRKSSNLLDDARDELKLSGERMVLYFKMIPDAKSEQPGPKYGPESSPLSSMSTKIGSSAS